MAVQNYSTDLFLLNINGRAITDYGETDPPVVHDEIDPQSVLRRGQGGHAVRLDRINPGRALTVNLNPGSPDSAFLSGLLVSKASLTCGYTQVGTLETAIGTQGVIVTKGSTGRGGQTITDDQYIIHFNTWSETTGGA